MERTILNGRHMAAAGALSAVLAFGMAGAATAAGYGQDDAQQRPSSGASPQFGGTVGGALMGGVPQTCPGFVERDIHGPQAIAYSWGVSIENYEGPQPPRYTWAELTRLGCDTSGLTGSR